MGAKEEMFDIYDERMRQIGTAPRSEVHAKGLWHRTFQCWILTLEDGVPSLLFQRRHPGKDTFPGLLDISCAGHLLAGERVEDGVRELEEELGLAVTFGDLTPCGVYPEEDVLSPELIDREFCHLFVYRCDRPLSEYRLQPDEVTGLYKLVLPDVRKLADGSWGPFRAAGVASDNGTLRHEERTFAASDFVPHAKDCYELLLAAVDRMI